MAVLFISHSTGDDPQASALVAWLKANGFTDIFIDHGSIAAGDKWREALRASANSCRVVIFLVTPNWLASSECFGEFVAAWYMGKRLVPLFLLPPWDTLGDTARQRLGRVTGEDQGLDIKPCLGPDGALDLDRDARVAGLLKAGLLAAGANMRVGLDPEAFAIDRTLRDTPFPGLGSFGDEDADAALFYGRTREIAEILEILRSMRAARAERSLVIQGASGAGKSSLLKAGIIPRLRRETPAWLPLRAFRPGADPLLNFAQALARTAADFGQAEAYGVIRDRLLQSWSQVDRDGAGTLTDSGLKALVSTLEAEGAQLRQIADRPGATVLVSVDQAEEIARADGASGDALADYLRAAIASEATPWQLVFTIRSDSLPELQKHRRFHDLKGRGYDLRAIPNFRFDTLVEEPAKRYGVEVNPDLVDTLIEDAPKEDALPLLAFALQRLWRQYAATGRLTKDNYTSVGKLKGLIEDAAERALRGMKPDKDEALPASPPPKRLTDLGAETFVPALVQINDEGATIRRVSKWAEFSEDSQELLQRFDAWRLVVRKGAEENGGTAEVAHEALFREWTRLQVWLLPERERLEALRSLQLDAAAWDRSKRDAAFLNHRGKRLDDAAGLTGRERYAQRVSHIEHDYLAACQIAERAARAQRRRPEALAGGLAAILVAAGFGLYHERYLREQYFKYSEMGVVALPAEAERVLKAGDQIRECVKGCPEMVVVPAGEFKIGEDPTTYEQHIEKSFAMSRYEVTFAEWEVCVEARVCTPVGDSSWGRENRPVINVSWEDATQYADWLSRMTGKDYRLPREAEWEHAARAGSKAAYSFGYSETDLDAYAWYSSNSDSRTHPVGEKSPNSFGLYDVHGNVWEWVEDCWNENYEGARGNATPLVAGDCGQRVLRGGSWYDNPQLLRTARRIRFAANSRNDTIGFRLSRTLNP